MSWSYKMQGSHVCSECNSFGICSKVNVKNAQRDTDHCLWDVDFFTKKESLV